MPREPVKRTKGTVLGLLLMFTANCVSAQQNLPSMGEAVDNTLSPTEERQLGAQLMRQIRSELPLIHDVQIIEYLRTLGNRLAVASGSTGEQAFTFFIVDDPQINAFAIPGGYVGVNTGLIAAMEHEEQLASVLAHEVAHVTQRHHARAFATGNRTALTTAATVLAAILIGRAASAQAGQAALAAGLAASQQSSINFTRSNEIEADRIGIEILANADYDTSAMAETFAILRKQNSLTNGDTELQYLRTHPLDSNRIAEATDRASNHTVRGRLNSPDYIVFRTRLGVLSASDVGELSRFFQKQHSLSPSIASSYALALIHQRSNQPDEALRYLRDLDDLIADNVMVELLRADIHHLKEPRNDDAILENLAMLYPNRYAIVQKQVNQLRLNKKLGQAKEVANQYIRRSQNPNPLAWRQLASIQESLEDPASSHESLARYFEAIDELQRAMQQLELALRQTPPDSQDFLRLNASLKQVREKALKRRE